MSNDIASILKPTAADEAVGYLQILTSAVDVVAPGLGSVFGTLLGEVIPGQRRDRFEVYLTSLSRRLRNLEWLMQEKDIHRPAGIFAQEQIALIEDGGAAATKATSAERIEQITAVVVSGLRSPSEGDESALAARRLLGILLSLDVREIELLAIYAEAPTVAQPTNEQNEQRRIYLKTRLEHRYGELSIDIRMMLTRLISAGAIRNHTLGTPPPFEMHSITPVGQHLIATIETNEPPEAATSMTD